MVEPQEVKVYNVKFAPPPPPPPPHTTTMKINNKKDDCRILLKTASSEPCQLVQRSEHVHTCPISLIPRLSPPLEPGNKASATSKGTQHGRHTHHSVCTCHQQIRVSNTTDTPFGLMQLTMFAFPDMSLFVVVFFVGGGGGGRESLGTSLFSSLYGKALKPAKTKSIIWKG